MYSLLKTYYTRVAYSALWFKEWAKSIMIQKMIQVHETNNDPSTSNVNMKYHYQCSFTCVFTMMSYPDGQT